jgi:ATP-dependent Clp protease ATP-binding subunit ClpA
VKLSLDVLRRVLLEWTGAAGQSILLPDEASPQDKQTPVVPDREAIRQAFRGFVVAQDEAVDALADIVVRLRLGLKEPSVPLPLLFHGPAGTGKTIAARALAQILWPDDADRILALNLAEFSDGWSMNRLVGASLGYAGHEEGGLLSARLKQKPHSVVLLKNLAAAHPQVLEFFSDLVRHGGYIDTYGRHISARDLLLILHVNTSADSQRIGFTSSQRDHAVLDDDVVLEELHGDGVPERLIHSITSILRFPTLAPAAIRRIVGLRLDRLQKWFEQRKIHVEFTEALIDQLAARFRALPADHRSVATLVDRHVRPLIRTALLAKANEPAGLLVIDVEQEVG